MTQMIAPSFNSPPARMRIIVPLISTKWRKLFSHEKNRFIVGSHTSSNYPLKKILSITDRVKMRNYIGLAQDIDLLNSLTRVCMK